MIHVFIPIATEMVTIVNSCQLAVISAIVNFATLLNICGFNYSPKNCKRFIKMNRACGSSAMSVCGGTDGQLEINSCGYTISQCDVYTFVLL